MKLICCVALAFCLLSFQDVHAQQWIQSIAKGDTNFYSIQKSFYDYYNSKQTNQPVREEEEGDDELAKFKRWEWFMEPRVYPSGNISLPSKNWQEFQKYIQTSQTLKQKSTAQSVSNSWTSLGPFNPTSSPIYGFRGIGRVDFVRFDPANANIMWAGSPSGGLWKSTNGGQSWNTNTDLLTVVGCADLVIDPTNSDIMYLATGDRDALATNSIGVLKSTDGGITWNATGLTFPVAYTRRIYKLLMDDTNTNIIFAATSDGIYKTKDGGSNWTLIETGYFSDIQFKPGDPGTVYAVSKYIDYPKFYKSTDTGATFVNITSGLPADPNMNRFAIAVAPSNPDYVYIIACNNNANPAFAGLYLSTNSGTDFSTQCTTPDIIQSQGWYDMCIVINPSNANDIYVGGLAQWRSLNGGVTWSQLCCTHADIHELDFLPGSLTTVFSCNDGGIYKTTDNGATWNDMSKGLAISQMYRLGTSATNSGFNLTGLQDNGTFRENDSAWDWIYPGDGMECIIDYTDTNIVYAESQYGNIVKSTDGGTTFSNTIASIDGSGINENGGWVTPYVINPTNHKTLLVGKKQVYRSIDGGSDWSQVGIVSLNGDNIVSLEYAPSDTNYIYAAGPDQFYSSTDGNSFIDKTGSLPIGASLITYIAVSNTDPNKVWVTLSGYADGEKVFMSTDAGSTWTNYSDGLPNLPADCIVYQNGSSDRLYLGMDVGVYYRDNSMSSWQLYNDGLPNVIVNELEIQYSSGKLRAATYGRGLWECDILPLENPDITFSGNVYLQGAYNTSSNNMNSTLNTLGILQTNASAQPYSNSAFNYAGTENVTSDFFASHTDIVDWILLELRDSASPSTVIATRAAFVKQDGSIVDTDGVNTQITFKNVPFGHYFVAVHHRNHLGIRSSVAIDFTAGSGSYDFTTSAADCYQNQSYTSTVQIGSIWAMRAGNANSNNSVKYNGPGNDENQILNIKLAGSLSNVLINVYSAEDVNMNGNVKWNGPGNDQNFLLNTVLNGSLSTVYLEQL